MKLAAIARRFDRQVLLDAYTLQPIGKGQFDVFDESRRDGMSIERRILSTAPSVAMPARKTLSYDGRTWLVGDSQRDYYKDSAVRDKYVVHQATELVSVKTLAEALGTGGLSAWASKVWVKGTKEIDTSSGIFNEFNFYFAVGEPVSEGNLILMGSRWHIVRSVYTGSAGLLVVLAEELPGTVLTTATFAKRVYDPVTDTYSGTPATVAALNLRWQTHFSYPAVGTETFKEGDVVLAVLKTALTAAVGDKVTVGSLTYAIAAVRDEGLCWATHLRRA